MTLMWLPWSRRIPGGWRLLRGQRRTHHHRYCRLIYKVPA